MSLNLIFIIQGKEQVPKWIPLWLPEEELFNSRVSLFWKVFSSNSRDPFTTSTIKAINPISNITEKLLLKAIVILIFNMFDVTSFEIHKYR